MQEHVGLRPKDQSMYSVGALLRGLFVLLWLSADGNGKKGCQLFHSPFPDTPIKRLEQPPPCDYNIELALLVIPQTDTYTNST